MLRKVRRVASNPRFLRSRLNRIGTDINSALHRRFASKGGVDVFDEDWDVLLILDACRYDDFASIATLPGETEKRRSLASTSGEWYEENVGEDDHYDTVCVTANPHTQPFVDQFHAVEMLFSDRHWDRELCTVPPDVVAERVRAVAADYPDKRIVGHFMQPHFPAIGPMRHELPVAGNPPETVETEGSHLGIQTYLRGRIDGVTEEKARAAYRENLRLVLEEVADLESEIDGKIVVTSDHGELFGERLTPIPVRGVLHKAHIRADPLVDVPWHTLPYESRREVESAEPETEAARVDDATVESRLSALGYR